MSRDMAKLAIHPLVRSNFGPYTFIGGKGTKGQHRNLGTQEHRTQEHWNTGTQEHRNTETWEHGNLYL